MNPYLRVRHVLIYSKGRHRGVLVLKAYFDESGDHDKPLICMGGCMADVDAWEKFEKDWAEVLARYKVDQLHTSQLMCHVPQEEYEGWTREKGDLLLNELVPIIARTVRLYIASHENVGDYELLSQPKDDPYFNCLLQCVDCSADFISKLESNEKVEMIFAEHPKHTGRVRFLMPMIREVSSMYSRLGPDAYGSPKDILPLQAADFIAFLYRKEQERRAKGCKWPMSPWLEKLKDEAWCNRGCFSFDNW